jgi:hypothetical protein
MVLLMAVTNNYNQAFSQDSLSLCTVKDGKMYIWLSKKLPEARLDEFIDQFDLKHLAIKRFINTGK